MNSGTKKVAARKDLIALCSKAIKSLEANPSARKVERGYAVLTRDENRAVESLLGPEGQELFYDVSRRFLDAVEARCTAAVLKSVEDGYYYWREELAERAGS
jgi:hypothetical protein